MSFSAVQTYTRSILSHVPWWHFAVIGILALTVILLARKRRSVYGAACLGISVFLGLFLLDAAVGIRYLGHMPHMAGVDFRIRLFHVSTQRPAEVFSNLAVFVPIGFFLSEFLASTKRFGAWRRILLATLAALGLSLCIELLQLVLKVGFFEVTDLLLNTVGGGVGAWVAVLMRLVFGKKEVRSSRA